MADAKTLRERIMELADEYARCAVTTAHAEMSYGTGKSYTAECQREENKARSVLDSALAAQAQAEPVNRAVLQNDWSDMPVAWRRLWDFMGPTNSGEPTHTSNRATQAQAEPAQVEPTEGVEIHPHSLHGLIDAAGGVVLTGGGVALTSVQLAKFVALLAEYVAESRSITGETALQPVAQAEPVRKPLTERAVLDLMPTTIPASMDGELLWFARALERAHGITGDTNA